MGLGFGEEAMHESGSSGGGGVCTVDENKICFWNMHSQWNKTKGEGERVTREIIQEGLGVKVVGACGGH